MPSDSTKALATTTRKSPASARTLIGPALRQSIVARVTVHLKTCSQAAREFGLPRWEVETIIFEELARKASKAYELGYERGRSDWGPLPPAMALRRAA